MVDNGYIQETDPAILKEYIKTEYKDIKKQIQKPVSLTKELQPKKEGKVHWRKEGIKYKENQIYIDIIEEISQTTDLSGNILLFKIQGKIQANSELSNMP